MTAHPPTLVDLAALDALESPGDLRMDAYYYGFDATGYRPVDEILSAVARAGKAYHHTESWYGSDSPNFPMENVVQPIQEAANRAAAIKGVASRLLAALRALAERLSVPTRHRGMDCRMPCAVCAEDHAKQECARSLRALLGEADR